MGGLDLSGSVDIDRRISRKSPSSARKVEQVREIELHIRRLLQEPAGECRHGLRAAVAWFAFVRDPSPLVGRDRATDALAKFRMLPSFRSPDAAHDRQRGRLVQAGNDCGCTGPAREWGCARWK